MLLLLVLIGLVFCVPKINTASRSAPTRRNIKTSTKSTLKEINKCENRKSIRSSGQKNNAKRNEINKRAIYRKTSASTVAAEPTKRKKYIQRKTTANSRQWSSVWAGRKQIVYFIEIYKFLTAKNEQMSIRIVWFCFLRKWWPHDSFCAADESSDNRAQPWIHTYINVYS